MKVTLKEIVVKSKALQLVSDKKLPIKISYAVSKNMAAFKEESELVEKERIKLLESYAEKNDDGDPIIEGGRYRLGDEGYEGFRREFEEYLNTEIDVDVHQIPIDELDKLEDQRYDVLSPAEMDCLDFMLQKANIQ